MHEPVLVQVAQPAQHGREIGPHVLLDQRLARAPREQRREVATPRGAAHNVQPAAVEERVHVLDDARATQRLSLIHI